MEGFYSSCCVIPAIVLAGGKSSRMGRPKALLPIRAMGETFLDRIIRTLLDAGVTEVVVVTGADADAIRARTATPERVRLIENPDYERGQLTSLLAGLAAIDRIRSPAVLVTLVDVPLVTVNTVRTLMGVVRATTCADCSPCFERPARPSGDFRSARCFPSSSAPTRHLVPSRSSRALTPRRCSRCRSMTKAPLPISTRRRTTSDLLGLG